MTLPLFHGTNSNEEYVVSVDGDKITKLFGHWTTHPGEAMTYAYLTTRKFGGRMVVFYLPTWDFRHFERKGEQLALNRTEEWSNWYRLTELGSDACHKTGCLEQGSVVIYSQAEMETIIEQHCMNKERERRFLQVQLELLAKR